MIIGSNVFHAYTQILVETIFMILYILHFKLLRYASNIGCLHNIIKVISSVLTMSFAAMDYYTDTTYYKKVLGLSPSTS